MRNLLLILTTLLCISVLNGQKYKELYKDQLEPNSKLLESGANYTLEETKDGRFILKRFYTGDKTLTHFITYKDKKLNRKDGYYEEYYDDGTLVRGGLFVDDEKKGEWVEDTYSKGFYVNNKKQGVWSNFHKNSKLSLIANYTQGLRHGNFIHYDTVGNVVFKEVFEMDKLVSSDIDTTGKSNSSMPRFPGCEISNLSESDRNACAKQKLLNYIFANFKVPKSAGKLGIDGQTLTTFDVDKSGKIININPLRSLTKEIKDELISLFEGMPIWKPGYINGEPVRTQFTVPIKITANN